MSGLFSTFNIVKRGMMANQTSLHVISHNIANADTNGYSVQRAEYKTSEPFGMPSLSSAGTVGQLGTGVLVGRISRARDIFLDGQIRKELSTINNYHAREQFLSEIETIFMEPSDNGLATNLSKFWDGWNQLSQTPESSTARTLVVETADDLATSIRHNYEQLENMEKNAGDIIKNQVFEVNSILKQIAELNEQIKTVVITKMEPNDLLDRRDLLLNQLSERFSYDTVEGDYYGIEIKPKANGYTETDGSAKSIVKDKTVNNTLSYIAGYKLGGSDPLNPDILNLTVYADGDSDKQYNISINFKDPANKDLVESIASVVKDGSGNITGITGLKTHAVFSNYDGTTPPALTVGAQFKDGSIYGNEVIKTEIDNYKSRLNRLATALSVTVNTIHSNNSNSGTISAKDSMNIFVTEGENEEYKKVPSGSVSIISALESDPEAAKNIRINQKFKDNVSLLDAGKTKDATGTDPSGQGNGERAKLIGGLRNLRLDIQGIDRDKFLNENFGITIPISSDNPDLTQVEAKTKESGFTMDSYFKDAISKLGVDSEQAGKIVVNQSALLSQLETRRESISGVSLEEETTNMLQFQRSFEANSKMISVIDELLDVVVNGLKR